MSSKKVIVVVCGIIKRGNKFLLTQRKEPLRFRGKWQFPGGELEPHETILSCLKREMQEELGVEVMKAQFIPHIWEFFRENLHLVFFCYLCQIDKHQKKFVLDKETMNYNWFSYQQIKYLNILELTDEFAKATISLDN